jgi:hypothetical protein
LLFESRRSLVSVLFTLEKDALVAQWLARLVCERRSLGWVRKYTKLPLDYFLERIIEIEQSQLMVLKNGRKGTKHFRLLVPTSL